MKFSEQWLRQWVNIEASTEELTSKLTMAGLEVDGIESVAVPFSGIVIAEIIACEQHPDADKLQVTTVNTGSEAFQVVCGAANARVGIKVPFATVGAVLPGNFKIKKAKLRGIDSFGMLCAEEEMGISETSDGLMELPVDAPLGENIREYLKLEDNIIDIDLTPNRGDCLSILGLSREVSANFLAEASEELVSSVSQTIEDCFAINVIAQEACPRYVGRVIKNVDVSCKPPLWLVERLRRSGIRSIDPVVDVTNYVMLELGQPMHGFDLAKIKGSIHVRMANIEEKLVLLDGQEVTLQTDTLVIADDQKALAIAGVMGGEGSGVSDNTCDIFLESAFFNPIVIAGKARSYGLHTDSSHRFERGVDYQLQGKAIERATGLILEICGGEPGPLTDVVSEAYLPKQKTVVLHSERVAALLGVIIEDSHIVALLTRLGLTMTTVSEATWEVAVPSWRFDISIEEDLIEELGRIYGYDNLPATTALAPLKIQPLDEAKVQEADLRRIMVSRGYQEVILFSFIDPKLHALFDSNREPVKLKNPIASDLSVMRTSLLPGLVKTVAYNLNRQQNRVRLFETGQVFIKEASMQQCIQQEQKLAAVITGYRFPENWEGDREKVDFYDLKGDVEALLEIGGNSGVFNFVKAEHPTMHPGQCAEIHFQKRLVGHIGALHPSLAKAMDIAEELYLIEISLDAVTNGLVSRYEPLSKYPEVRRDLALIVAKTVTADSLCSAIRKEGGELLRDVHVFDVYAGKEIAEGYKSLALGLTLQHHSGTLKEEDVGGLVDRIVAKLEMDFKASLRK